MRDKLLVKGISKEKLNQKSICIKCHEDKFGYEYPWVRRGKKAYYYKNTRCLLCKAAYHKEYTSSEKFRKRRFHQYRETMGSNGEAALQVRCAQLRSDARTRSKKKSLAFDLTTEFIRELYEKQNGKCYYTGEALVYNNSTGKPLPNSMSLDKMTPSKGYAKDNMVLCTFFTNTAKQDLTKEEFLAQCALILQLKDKRDE